MKGKYILVLMDRHQNTWELGPLDDFDEAYRIGIIYLNLWRDVYDFFVKQEINKAV